MKGIDERIVVVLQLHGRFDDGGHKRGCVHIQLKALSLHACKNIFHEERKDWKGMSDEDSLLLHDKQHIANRSLNLTIGRIASVKEDLKLSY